MGDEIKERKEKHPYHIDEMPIQPADLHRRVVFPGVIPAPRFPGQNGQGSDPDQDVQGVQAGHAEIEREKQLHLVVRRRTRVVERFPGDVVVRVILEVFKPVQRQITAAGTPTISAIQPVPNGRPSPS